jgi:hypothetical protein
VLSLYYIRSEATYCIYSSSTQHTATRSTAIIVTLTLLRQACFARTAQSTADRPGVVQHAHKQTSPVSTHTGVSIMQCTIHVATVMYAGAVWAEAECLPGGHKLVQ